MPLKLVLMQGEVERQWSDITGFPEMQQQLPDPQYATQLKAMGESAIGIGDVTGFRIIDRSTGEEYKAD